MIDEKICELKIPKQPLSFFNTKKAMGKEPHGKIFKFHYFKETSQHYKFTYDHCFYIL